MKYTKISLKLIIRQELHQIFWYVLCLWKEQKWSGAKTAWFSFIIRSSLPSTKNALRAVDIHCLSVCDLLSACKPLTRLF